LVSVYKNNNKSRLVRRNNQKFNSLFFKILLKIQDSAEKIQDSAELIAARWLAQIKNQQPIKFRLPAFGSFHWSTFIDQRQQFAGQPGHSKTFNNTIKQQRTMEKQPKKKRRTYNKGWLSFLKAKDFSDYTDNYDTISTQRISINPRYLHHRTENFLLKLLLELVDNCDHALEWWKASNYVESTFKYRFRGELGPLILSVLTTEASVKCYILFMRISGEDEGIERSKLRTQLFGKKGKKSVNWQEVQFIFWQKRQKNRSTDKKLTLTVWRILGCFYSLCWIEFYWLIWLFGK